MTNDERYAFRGSSFLFSAPPNLRKNQVQCSGFESQVSRLGFQFGNRASRHSQKVLRLTRFFLARANALQKFFFRNGIVGFIVIGANAGSCTDQLIYDSVCQRPRRDLLREINYCFAESRCALFQIVNAVLLRLFTDDPFCILIPERIIGATWLMSFGFRHSFGIRHSSFVIDQYSLVIRHTPFVIYANMSVMQRA